MTDRNERRPTRDDRDDDRRAPERSSRDRAPERSTRNRDDEPRHSSRDRDDPPRRSSRGSDREDSPRSGRSFSYQERTADQTKQRATMGASDFDSILKPGVKTFKPNAGDNRIRILPPTWKDPKHFGLDIYVHYGVGPDRGQYLCLSKMKNEADPIEEERQALRAEGNPGDEKYLKSIDAKRRVLVYLIDRDHENLGVQAWAMPWTLDRDIVKVSVDRQSGEVLPIDHPEDGFDVEFSKDGEKDRTEYNGVAIARRSSPLGNSKALDHAVDNPLPDILHYYDYDHIAKAFKGAARPHDREDDSRDDRRAGGHRERPDDRRDRETPSHSEREGRSSHGGDEPRRSSRSREEPDEPTWESVHSMTLPEMEDLVDLKRLTDINPAEAKDDEDLADWICDELKLKKTERRVERRGSGDDSASDKLRRMREERGS
jgi:hypothetical protein